MRRVQYVCAATVYDTVELEIPDGIDPSEFETEALLAADRD